jgi:hypothetical protein
MPADTSTLVSGAISALVSGEIMTTHQFEGPYYPDSLEIGTPSKGGSVKVYGNLDDPTTFETRVRSAMALRALAQDLANPEV